MLAIALAVICLSSPVNGPVVAGYSPQGRYGGHWGVDFSADIGESVEAPTSGLVTFAGSVAGMNSVTIQPVPGYKVSVSYLREVSLTTGIWIALGSPVGTSGLAHGTPGVHLSLRIEDRYVDPAAHLGCRRTDITRALKLVTPPRPYPRRRANRDFRRNLRSTTSGSHLGGTGGTVPSRVGSGAFHPRR